MRKSSSDSVYVPTGAMKILMRTNAAGPNGVFEAGKIVDVDDDLAREWIAKRNAVPVFDRPDRALLDAPWPEDGCTLDEARRRTVDRQHWKAAVEAENALVLAGGRGRRRAYLNAPLDGDREVASKARAEQHRRQLERTADAAWRPLNSRFQRLLIDGRLVATGTNARPSEAPSIIPPTTWNHMQVRDWARSVAVERTKTKDAWYGVRVYPPLLSTCGLDLMAGRPLAETFKQYVLQDPELEAGLRWHGYRSFEEILHFDDRLPVDLHSFDGYRDLLNKTRSHWELPDLSEARTKKAFEIFWQRWACFLQPLRSGVLVARGMHQRSGDVKVVDINQWIRSAVWVDVKNGDLLEKTNDTFAISWSGLALFHVKAMASDVLPATAIEPKPAPLKKSIANAATKAKAYDACVAWLVQIMEASPTERTASKANLWSQAHLKWPGTLSERAFIRAWTEAVNISVAPAWGLPGALKKQYRMKSTHQ
jgi:hypothetical protein